MCQILYSNAENNGKYGRLIGTGSFHNEALTMHYDISMLNCFLYIYKLKHEGVFVGKVYFWIKTFIPKIFKMCLQENIFTRGKT